MIDLQISDFTPVDKLPENSVEVPTLLQGEFGKVVLAEYQKQVREKYQDNDSLKALSSDRKGSNIFISGLLYKILGPKFRPVIPADDRDGKISALVKDKHYTDFNALIVRSNKPTYKKNPNILRNIIETTEEKQGKIQFPFMITGFSTDSWPEDIEGYDLKFAPEKDFSCVSDERLNGKKYPYGTRFTNVDDLGLPLFDKNGTRIWYAKEQGVSRLFLTCDLVLYSSDGNLAGSYPGGRVVVVSAEGSL
ncbi:MAG: hypothetical protein ABIG37_00725 [Nanoarchaeota archaeon]